MSNDEVIKKEFERLNYQEQNWFRNSGIYIQQGNFFTSLERELEEYCEEIIKNGSYEELFEKLCPSEMKEYLKNDEIIQYVRGAWEASIIVDMELKHSIPKNSFLTRGNLIIGSGTLVFSREHALKFLCDVSKNKMPIVNALSKDFLADYSYRFRNAYAHGYILIPNENDKTIIFVTDNKYEQSKRYDVSVLLIGFYLRLFFWFSFYIYVKLIFPLVKYIEKNNK
jgi:hypothetical protein